MQQKGTWRKSLQDIIRQNNREALRKSKVISHATMQDRAEILFMSFTQLRQMGFKLEEPRNLKPRHVQALVTRWEQTDQLSASTLQKRLSVLRGFAKWIGKEGMIGPTEHLVINHAMAKRSYVAIQDKSWTAQYVDPRTLIAKVRAEDPYVGMQLKMMWAFGMRRKEAICFKPRRNDRGEFIEVGEGAVIFLKEGTKGGRERLVDVDFMPDAAERRSVLEEAKAMVGNEDAHLGRPGRTLIQNLNRFEYLMRKYGMTKRERGITSHGLRHQAMNDGYEALSGVASPVRGGGVVDAETDAKAKLRMTRNAGHNRQRITGAYYGASLKPPLS